MKRTTTTTLLSLLALLTLSGLGIWMGLHRSDTPQTASQPAQGVPLDSPLAVVVSNTVMASFPPMATYPAPASMLPIATAYPLTGTYEPYPTIEPSPMPTWNVNLEVYKPTATLTQKEQIVFDPVNGFTLTLPIGFYTKLPAGNLPADMFFRNYDIGEDPRMQIPDNWISVFIGVGKTTTQAGFEQFVEARHSEEVNQAKEAGIDFQSGEIQTFSLGPYQGYSYEVFGPMEFPRNYTGKTFIKSQVILLPLDAGRFAQASVMNIDSSDYQKVMQSLKTLRFAPASSISMPMSATPTIAPAIPFTGTYPVYPTFEPTPMPLPTLGYGVPIYELTATLTQKEEVIFDLVNGITMTLPSGFYVRLPTQNLPGTLTIRNLDLGTDPRLKAPDNWINVEIGVTEIPIQESIEKMATDGRQEQVNFSLKQKNDFQYGELEPIILGLYHGYTYVFSGSGMDSPWPYPIKSQLIYLQLEEGRYAQILVYNLDSPDWSKLLKSLNTLVFAPKALP